MSAIQSIKNQSIKQIKQSKKSKQITKLEGMKSPEWSDPDFDEMNFDEGLKCAEEPGMFEVVQAKIKSGLIKTEEIKPATINDLTTQIINLIQNELTTLEEKSKILKTDEDNNKQAIKFIENVIKENQRLRQEALAKASKISDELTGINGEIAELKAKIQALKPAVVKQPVQKKLTAAELVKNSNKARQIVNPIPQKDKKNNVDNVVIEIVESEQIAAKSDEPAFTTVRTNKNNKGKAKKQGFPPKKSESLLERAPRNPTQYVTPDTHHSKILVSDFTPEFTEDGYLICCAKDCINQNSKFGRVHEKHDSVVELIPRPFCKVPKINKKTKKIEYDSAGKILFKFKYGAVHLPVCSEDCRIQLFGDVGTVEEQLKTLDTKSAAKLEKRLFDDFGVKLQYGNRRDAWGYEIKY